MTIESAFYKIQDVPEFNVVRQLGEPGHRETNGFAVWIADDKSLKRLAQLIQANPQNEKIAAPRAVTADGVQSALWVGSSPLINGQIKKVGLDVRMVPVLRPEISDFTMFASFTEVLTNSIGTGESQKMTKLPVRTNLAISAEFQIPKDCGIFLISTGGEKGGPQSALMLYLKR